MALILDYLLSFLFAYYGLFFGIMRAFKNKNNYNSSTETTPSDAEIAVIILSCEIFLGS